MGLDYSTSGEVKISIITYLKNVVTKFPEELKSISTSPATDHMFKLRFDET